VGQRTINASPRSEIRPALAWDLIGAPPAYDRQTYTVLFLRALESLFAPVGVDASTLALWLLGDAGYWGPPSIRPASTGAGPSWQPNGPTGAPFPRHGPRWPHTKSAIPGNQRWQPRPCNKQPIRGPAQPQFSLATCADGRGPAGWPWSKA